MAIVAAVQKRLNKAPKIWMVTGIQYIEGGNVTNSASGATSGKTQATVPVPDPMLAAAAVSIKGGVSGNTSGSTASEYGHAEERVWAAQFRPLKVEYCRPGDGTRGSTDGGRAWIKLHDPENLKQHGVRAEDDEEEDVIERLAPFAQVVGTDDGEYSGNGQEMSPQAVLDSMLDSDWALLDELLDSGEDLDEDHTLA